MLSKCTSRAASLTLLKGVSVNVAVAGRRLLGPFSVMPPENEEAYNYEVFMEAIDGWQILVLEFFKHSRLPVNPDITAELIPR